jgi:hypothetical protein
VSAAAPAMAGPARMDRTTLAVVAALGAVALAADVATGGNVAACAGIMLGVAMLALVWVVPLRWSLTAFLFLGVALEAPYEAFAAYIFRTPWNVLGQVFLGNLNLTTNISAMKFSGFDLMLVYLFVVHGVRRARGNDIDTRGSVPLARPMVIGVSISLATMLVLWVQGLATGGTFFESLLQVQKTVYAILLMVLMHGAYRGAKDLRTLALTLVCGAMYRSLLATYIHFTVRWTDGTHLSYSTTHADSRLFAAALVCLVVMISERVPGATHWSRFAAMGTILMGMVLNHRRLAWVATAGCVLVVALISTWTPLKRRIARAGLILMPLVVLYIAAGWNHANSSVFRPVGTMRSILDSKSDGSTLWRDLENMNLAMNVSAHPFWGVGFGHEYVEHILLPDVSQAYPRFKYLPHNSLLALFPFAGPVGVCGMFAMLLTTVFLAARTYHRSPSPAIRSAAMMSIVFVFLHLNQTYGDIGVGEWLTTFTLAPAMLLAGKLSVESGAWEWTPRKSSLRILERKRREASLGAMAGSGAAQ